METRRKLEVFHTRCCRRMMNVSIYDVIANHELSNKNILKELGMLKLEAYLELRRTRWLEKLSHMSHTRAPRLLLGSWIQKPRRNGQAGRAQNTIRHAYASTLSKLGYTDKNCSFKIWMNDARNRKIWSRRVEHFLGLKKGMYSRENAVHHAAGLREINPAAGLREINPIET